MTDQPDTDLAVLDTRHRARARVEDLIRGAKDTCAEPAVDTFRRNAVWLQLVLTAQDLMCFTANVCLDGELRVAVPAWLRYQLLHVPARIVATGRRVIMRIQHDWPWAQQLLTAFARAAQPAATRNLTPGRSSVRRSFTVQTRHHDGTAVDLIVPQSPPARTARRLPVPARSINHPNRSTHAT